MEGWPKVAFKRLVREPMCAYCGELAAQFLVLIGDAEYPACVECKEAVKWGLHQCDYICEEEHDDLWRMLADPEAESWKRERDVRARFRAHSVE